MKKFRFHFNIEYAADLRDAVNDRRKQSIENVHSEKGLKDYYAWNRTCAAMDRLQDTLCYLNTCELGNNDQFRSAFDFYDFINNAYVVIECIKTIGKIFRIDNRLFEDIEKSSSVFGTEQSDDSTDGKYFEYIRSLCSVHPLCTNRQKEFLDGSQFHCCPFVVWNDRISSLASRDADLIAWIYPSKKGAESILRSLYVSQFEQYLSKWIELIPEIIEAKNNYTENEYEKLRNEPVKSLSEYDNDTVRYLSYLKGEYCKRFDYGDDYLFDEYIRIFTINITDHRNKELLEKYRCAIIYSLTFLRNELQNMCYEGYDNNGIVHPDHNEETTLFDSLYSFSLYNSSFSKYSYNLGKIDYLDEDNNYYDKVYARWLLEEPKEQINRYVYFTNTESDEETIVLVNLALYLESLTRKSLLNRNVPNELKYRIQVLSEDQLKELYMEDKVDEDQTNATEKFQKLLEEYGGSRS